MQDLAGRLDGMSERREIERALDDLEYLMEVLDDLVEAGIDGLNPIETVAGMSLKEIREKYGDRLFLAGGIDMSQLLSNGAPDEVRDACRQAVRDAYPGYFMGL